MTFSQRGSLVCAIIRPNAEDLEDEQRRTLSESMDFLLDEVGALLSAAEEAKVVAYVFHSRFTPNAANPNLYLQVGERISNYGRENPQAQG